MFVLGQPTRRLFYFVELLLAYHQCSLHYDGGGPSTLTERNDLLYLLPWSSEQQGRTPINGRKAQTQLRKAAKLLGITLLVNCNVVAETDKRKNHPPQVPERLH